eukprot:s1675_g10.t1
MNGLRRAPLLWFLEMKGTLLTIGWQETADAAVFRRIDAQGRLQLILLYVDDTILMGSTEACLEVIEALGAKYTIKETGRMVGTQTGHLEFLGRVISREVHGGPLLMGVNDSYFDEIEKASGLTLSSSPRVPDLTKFVEEEKDQVLLSRERAEVFRTVLGKMSWLAISLPSIVYCTSWLSCFQSNPTEKAWSAMVAVLKFLRTQRGLRQSFPCQDCDVGMHEDWQVVGTVDASWSLRSVMGGYLHYKGNFLKGWSRRIPVPCLSSAEAELFTLVEGLKESIAMSLLLESIVHGLPARNDLGFFERTEGRFKIVLRTDSQAALQIGKMQGLLRRVRHLELRVAVLQFYTNSGRLEILFIPGAVNGSDALTKPGDAVHQGILLKECGLVMAQNSEKTNHLLHSWMQDLGLMSNQNRSRVVHCLGKLVRHLLDAGVVQTRLQLLLDENLSALPLPGVGVSEGIVPQGVLPTKSHDLALEETGRPVMDRNSENSERSGNRVADKTVAFVEEPEVKVFSTRGLSRKWVRLLRKYPHLEVFRESPWAYFGIDETVDLAHTGTQALLRLLIQQASKLVCWIATPSVSSTQLIQNYLQKSSKTGAHRSFSSTEVQLAARMMNSAPRLADSNDPTQWETEPAVVDSDEVILSHGDVPNSPEGGEGKAPVDSSPKELRKKSEVCLKCGLVKCETGHSGMQTEKKEEKEESCEVPPPERPVGPFSKGPCVENVFQFLSCGLGRLGGVQCLGSMPKVSPGICDEGSP